MSCKVVYIEALFNLGYQNTLTLLMIIYSRSQQTVVAETREGSTYSKSVSLNENDEDIEEIPAPKYAPIFEHMSVGDKKKTTEIYFDSETTGFGKI